MSKEESLDTTHPVSRRDMLGLVGILGATGAAGLTGCVEEPIVDLGIEQATTALLGNTPNVVDVSQHPMFPVLTTNSGGQNRVNLTAIIAELPFVTGKPPIGTLEYSHYSHSSVLLFPSDVDPYDFAGTVLVPNDKSILFATEAQNGASIRQTIATAGFTFDLLGDGTRTIGFENLVFEIGGVRIMGTSRRYTNFRNCLFLRTSNYGIYMLTSTGMGGVIDNCEFSRCAGGVKVLEQNSDLWKIRNCIFNRNTKADISIKSTGISIENCDFEVRPDTEPDEPFILLRQGGNTISRCRFGNEVDSGHQPPVAAIVVGELTPNASLIPDVTIDGCLFRGRIEAGPTSTSGTHAIIFNSRPVRFRITNNSFNKYDSYLLDYRCTHFNGAEQCFWLGNTIKGIDSGEPPNLLFDHSAGTFGGPVDSSGIVIHDLFREGFTITGKTTDVIPPPGTSLFYFGGSASNGLPVWFSPPDLGTWDGGWVAADGALIVPLDAGVTTDGFGYPL